MTNNSKNADLSELSLLQDEYKANIQILFHADNIRQSRMNGFLSVNAFLLAGFGVLIAQEQSLWTDAFLCLMSILAVIICRALRLAHLRNDRFLKFRRYQLRDIEARIGTYSTFRNSKSAIGSGTHSFTYSGERFDEPKLKGKTSGQIDRFLIDVVALIWAIVLLAIILGRII